MAITFAKFDASTTSGGRVAVGVDKTNAGFDELKIAIGSAIGVTGSALDSGAANSVKDLLVGGAFGAEDATNARLMYNAMYTVKYWIDQLQAGGFFQALADLDKGSSG